MQADFFIKGNKVMHEMYPKGLPWETSGGAK